MTLRFLSFLLSLLDALHAPEWVYGAVERRWLSAFVAERAARLGAVLTAEQQDAEREYVKGINFDA